MLQYWKQKEILNYPNAKGMVQYWEQLTENIMQQEQAMQVEQMQQTTALDEVQL
jgi:hypothetical protein